MKASTMRITSFSGSSFGIDTFRYAHVISVTTTSSPSEHARAACAKKPVIVHVAEVVSDRVYKLLSWRSPPATKRALTIVRIVCPLPSLPASTFVVMFIWDGITPFAWDDESSPRWHPLSTFILVILTRSGMIAGSAISLISFMARLAVMWKE